MPFLHLVTILDDYIPDSDDRYWDSVKVYVRKAVDESKGGSRELAKAIIVGGHMRRSAELYEQNLHLLPVRRRISNWHSLNLTRKVTIFETASSSGLSIPFRGGHLLGWAR